MPQSNVATNKCENGPSSIRLWGLNSRFLWHESDPVTTKPGRNVLPLQHFAKYKEKIQKLSVVLKRPLGYCRQRKKFQSKISILPEKQFCFDANFNGYCHAWLLAFTCTHLHHCRDASFDEKREKMIKSKILRGAAVAQWICLYLPSCLSGFESQAQHLCFHHLCQFCAIFSCEKTQK